MLRSLLALAAGCGRINFETHIDAAAPPDAYVDPACNVHDGVCLYGCAGLDVDCATTCGDGICIGNADELCSNCPADCMTTNPVCGNGACDPGKSPICYADCGPTPWTWVANESDLLGKINTVRASGYTCPNGVRAPAPALGVASLEAAAHEWVWELSHQVYFMMGGTVCNGRTIVQRSMNFTLYQAAILATGPSYPTVDDALALWLTRASDCDALLNPTFTTTSTGVAEDYKPSYVVLLVQ